MQGFIGASELDIDEWVNFSTFGRNLVYSNGWLTGFLQDGSWFNNQLTFGANWHGTFSIHNVPEPGTLGLLAGCLIALGLAGRRMRPSYPSDGLTVPVSPIGVPSRTLREAGQRDSFPGQGKAATLQRLTSQIVAESSDA